MSTKKKVLFSAVVFGLTLTGLEGAARLVRSARAAPVPQSDDSPRPTLRHEVLHHIWRPSLRHVNTSREVPFTLVTNRQSWVEGYDVDPVKPAGTYRIFYVGDSNTQGVVNAEYKMVELVERELNTRALGQARFEVINAGTSSYSPLLYYLQIKDCMLPYSPDLVVLNVDMTDVVNDYVYRKTLVVDDAGAPLAVLPSAHIDTSRYRMTPYGLVQLSSVAPLSQALIESSALCYYADRVFAKLSGSGHADTSMSGILDDRANWLALQWTSQTSDHVDYSMGMICRTIRLLGAAGVRMMLTGVPHYPQFTGEWSVRPHQVLAQTAEAEHVAYLNSFEALKRAVLDASPEAYYWPSDPTHFNIAGNRLWADAQLAFLLDRRNHLLPEP